MDATSTMSGIHTLIGVLMDITNGKRPEISPDVWSEGRLVKLNNAYLVRPRIVISDKLKYSDPSTIKSIIDTELKIFIANYVQAFKILTNVYGFEARTVLSVLNRTNPTGRATVEFNGYESIDYAGEFMFKDEGFLTITAGYEANTKITVELKAKNKKDKNVKVGVGSKSTDDNIKLNQQFITTIDMAMEVTKKAGDRKDKDGNQVYGKSTITLPITIYPMISFTDSKTLLEDLFSDKSEEARFGNRRDEYKAGVISLGDLIFGTDLVKKYKEKRIKNENDVAKLIRGVNSSTTVKAMLTGENSFARNYNIYILDTDDKIAIDNLVKGNIYKTKYKNKALDAMHGFAITFVDMDKERLIQLLDNVEGHNVYSFKMLKKDKDVDVNEIFKNMLTNKSPF